MLYDPFMGSLFRSRGYAIVEYETVDQAKKAIDELNDIEILERKIFVREDRESQKGIATENRPPREEQGNVYQRAFEVRRFLCLCLRKRKG